jgi:hypothetical protein
MEGAGYLLQSGLLSCAVSFVLTGLKINTTGCVEKTLKKENGAVMRKRRVGSMFMQY